MATRCRGLNKLGRIIWRKRTARKRGRWLQMIGENADAGKAPRSEQSDHYNWTSVVQDSDPWIFEDLFCFPTDQKAMNDPEGRGGQLLGKHEDTAGELVSKRRLEKQGWDHGGSLEDAAGRLLCETGKIVVRDVPRHAIPGGVVAVDDTAGSEGDRGDEGNSIQANRWLVCEEEHVRVFAVGLSATDHVRNEPDRVWAEGTCTCWTVSVAESSGVDDIMGSVHGGIATGRKESIQLRGPQSRHQSRETARTEPVRNVADCDGMGGEKHDSQAWARELELGEN